MKKPTLAPAYASMFPGLAEIAQSMGYALAIHGSMVTDMDLIAVPWTKEAVGKQQLVERLATHIKALTGYDEEYKKPFGPNYPTAKPHGRVAWLIPLGHGAVIDLSVMPRKCLEVVRETDGVAEIQQSAGNHHS